jgi:hypothetical protein
MLQCHYSATRMLYGSQMAVLIIFDYILVIIIILRYGRRRRRHAVYGCNLTRRPPTTTVFTLK